MKTKSFLFVLLAALVVGIWGITFVCTKYLLNHFTAFEILIVRYFFAYCALWAIHPKKLKLQEKRHELYFILAGLSGVVIYQLMENMAIHYTNASNVSIIVSICPMFTAILSQLLLKEHSVTKRFVLGFVISITGVILVSFNGVVKFHLNPSGDVLALVSGISWGFYSILVSKINRLSLDPIAATRRIFFWALIFMLPIALSGAFLPFARNSSIFVNLSADANLQRFSLPLTWVNLLFLGLVASSFCFIAWNKVCAVLGTVNATVGIYMIPVVTVIFAWFVLGERLSPMGILGALFTISGVIISG